MKIYYFLIIVKNITKNANKIFYRNNFIRNVSINLVIVQIDSNSYECSIFKIPSIIEELGYNSLKHTP